MRRNMRKEPRIGERIKSLRGDMSQASFASLLGVQQATVSAWEVEDNVPSPEALTKIAALAQYPDALEQAGVSKDLMLSIAEKVLQERGAATVQGKMIEVPTVRISAAGKQEQADPYLIAARLVRNPLSTRCYVISERVWGIDTGEIEVIVDFSEAAPQRFRPYWNKSTLLELVLPPEKQRTGLPPQYDWPQRFCMGRPRCRTLSNTLFRAVLEPFTGLRLAERAKVDISIHLGYWDAQNVRGRRTLRLRGRSGFDLAKTKNRAELELRPHPGCTILGQVIDWVRPGAGKQ
jgi:transcriptional regulator with XRE-family HTH domain